MFQKLIVVVIFVFLTTVSTAQQFNAAIKAGISTSQVSGDNLSGYNKAGLLAGGSVGMELSRKFDLALEMLYIEKGSKRNSDPENGDYTYYRLRLNYFEFPLMLKWKFSKRFTFEGGLTYGVLIKESEEDEYGIINRNPPRPFNKGEFGGGGGLQVNFAKNFSFIARLQSSITAVRKHESGESYRFNKGQYNAVLSFAVQYNFRKGSAE